MCYDRMDQTNEERGRRRMACERLNVTDVCDVVEFHESADGVALYSPVLSDAERALSRAGLRAVAGERAASQRTVSRFG